MSDAAQPKPFTDRTAIVPGFMSGSGPSTTRLAWVAEP